MCPPVPSDKSGPRSILRENARTAGGRYSVQPFRELIMPPKLPQTVLRSSNRPRCARLTSDLTRSPLALLTSEIVPVKWHNTMFRHTLEGPDDMTGHVKVGGSLRSVG